MTCRYLEVDGDDVLFGRDRQLAAVERFLDAAVCRGGALLLSGGGGTGQSALLKRAAAIAAERGMGVLWSGGVEFSRELDFSGLRRLLSPLCGDISALSGEDRLVLDVALGLRDGAPAAALRVANALLSLLRHASVGRSLLIAVDDLHWMDRLSYQVLCLLGAQLEGTEIGLLGVVRAQDAAVHTTGLPVCDVEPLDEVSSRAVLMHHFPELAPRVRECVLAEAKGNPLALMELSRSLSAEQRESVAALPPVLAVSPRLRTVYGAQVCSLPEETRQLLLVAAYERAGDTAVLEAALGATDLAAALAPAEEAQLAGLDHARGKIVFRHPLVRTTVVAVASPAQRREAHRRLAGALVERPELHAWHLSESTMTADSAIADLVHDAAMTAMGRGMATSAVRLMRRSADLTADRCLRASRLGYAATMYVSMTGDLDTAARLAKDARELDPDFDNTLPAAMAAVAMLLNGEGEIEAAHGRLVTALGSRSVASVASPVFLRIALWQLARVCWFGGRAELWTSLLHLAEKYREHLTEFDVAAWTVSANPAHASRADLALIEREIARARTENNPFEIVRLAAVCTALDRIGEMRAALWRVVQIGRNGEAVTCASLALMHLCTDALVCGRWSDVEALGKEALQLCEKHDQRALTWVLHGRLAAVAALRGDIETTRALTCGLMASVAPREARVVQHLVIRARMMGALGRGDFEVAYQAALEIGPSDLNEPFSIRHTQVSLDFIDAAIHTNRHAEAEAHAKAIEASGVSSLSPRLAWQAAAVEALVAQRDRATALYERALALPGVDRWPYERARVQLAYGEHLRRLRASSGAQLQLRRALTTFRDLGAMPWVSRVEVELRAAGERGLAVQALPTGALTPQELEIVRLAAAGLTNKQIGERLYLSPRTVGNHLHRAFPKLGVASRASLRDALNLLGTDGPHS